MNILDFLIDPVFRGPLWGSLLMCFASSLLGVIAFIRKRSLLGEALSHASYPGVVIGAAIGGFLFPDIDNGFAIALLVGAGLAALIGLVFIYFLERKFKVKDDAALCFVLSSFLGIGVLIASGLQRTHPLWYRQVQVFLYGQVATMTDAHVLIYGVLSIGVVISLCVFFHQIEAVQFDRQFASSIGIRVRAIEYMLFIFLVLAIVIGIRSVGVILMSGMLIAPAVAARQLTHRLSTLFILSACFGIASGFIGNFLSMAIPTYWGGSDRLSLPTGPLILLVAAGAALLALLFSPQNGVFSRLWRGVRFRYRCRVENILKQAWKKGGEGVLLWDEVSHVGFISSLSSRLIIWNLLRQGWMERERSDSYRLSAEGKKWAQRIVRIHRLWEVYLVDYLGQGIEKVHKSAEEMEHLITPELERELTQLLRNPQLDPHQQPIPQNND